jgi:hypothetical protein
VKAGLDKAAHICNPVTLEVEIGRIVQGHPGRGRGEVAIPHLNQWLGLVVHTCHPRYVGSIEEQDQEYSRKKT